MSVYDCGCEAEAPAVDVKPRGKGYNVRAALVSDPLKQTAQELYVGTVRTVIVLTVPDSSLVTLSLRLGSPSADPVPVKAGQALRIEDVRDEPWAGVWFDWAGSGSAVPAQIFVSAEGVTPIPPFAQGPPASPGNAWPVVETVGGAVVSASNPLPTAKGVSPSYRVDLTGLALINGTTLELRNPGPLVMRVCALYLHAPTTAQRLTLRKQSSNSTGGASSTPAAQVPIPLDSTSAAAETTATVYTAVPTGGGALVGNVFNRSFSTTDEVYEEFGLHDGVQEMAIRAGESVALQGGAAGVLTDGYIEIRESAT